ELGLVLGDRVVITAPNCLLQVYSRVCLSVSGLLELGLVLGDRVVITAPNCLEYLDVLLGCSRVGVCLILIKSGSTPEELMTLVDRYKVKVVIVHSGGDASFGTSVVGKCNDFNHPMELVKVVCVDFHEDASFCTTYSTMLHKDLSETQTAAVFAAQQKVQMEDPLLALLTSGSTGPPKACLFNHFQFIRVSLNNMAAGSVPDGARFFNDRPFSWKVGVAAGLNFIPVRGITLISQPSAVSVTRGDLETSFRIMRTERCTHAVIMPYMLYDISKAKPSTGPELPPLLYGLTTGQVTQTDVIKSCVEKYPGLIILNIYGATEIDGWPSEEYAADNTESGALGWFKIQEGVEVKVVDDEGRMVPRGERGELYVRGPAVFEGYLDDENLTANALTPLRWFKTGDLAVMNDLDHIRILGRKSFAIKRATVYVNPADVESVLSENPLISQVAVVGVPDPRLHEELCACIIPSNDPETESEEVILKEIRDWCRKQFLPGPDGLTLAPRYFLLFSAFPLSHSGKTQQQELRKLAIEKLGLL
ncbi:acyl-CoA synthetase family member 2, mitochondrial-like, partial [Lingula anatina]|uniref:Acyl-CoA synthetase family member 2, mitochondrial-like n=1 Tax=Lingula anatina TaxID=7574 RepID=A0A1S3JLW4_LINAN